jgi:sec-independent protein translocase protein TatA
MRFNREVTIMFRLGPGELIILLVIFLVIFGPSKLPEAGRTLGNTIGEFKKAVKGIDTSNEGEQES